MSESVSIRLGLLAAVSIVIDRGPDAIEDLAGATIGGYRVHFDKIVSQLRAEIRIRQVVSQLRCYGARRGNGTIVAAMKRWSAPCHSWTT
jgi:hypothetical protein